MSVAEISAQVNTLSKIEKKQGFLLLFGGKTMEHWRNYRSGSINPEWQIINEELVMTQKGGGDLVTKKEFKYFDLRLEYDLAERGNSGILFRVDEDTDKRLPWMVAPEFQLYDSYNIKGKGVRAAGAIYGLIPSPADIAKKPGEFNQVRIVLRNEEEDKERLECWLNGTQTVDVVVDHIPGSEWSKIVAVRNEEKKGTKYEIPEEFFKTERGNILLQDHGARVAFRNIRILDLEK